MTLDGVTSGAASTEAQVKLQVSQQKKDAALVSKLITSATDEASRTNHSTGHRLNIAA